MNTRLPLEGIYLLRTKEYTSPARTNIPPPNEGTCVSRTEKYVPILLDSFSPHISIAKTFAGVYIYVHES